FAWPAARSGYRSRVAALRGGRFDRSIPAWRSIPPIAGQFDRRSSSLSPDRTPQLNCNLRTGEREALVLGSGSHPPFRPPGRYGAVGPRRRRSAHKTGFPAEPIRDERSNDYHEPGNRSEIRKVSDEVCEALVVFEWEKSPLGIELENCRSDAAKDSS